MKYVKIKIFEQLKLTIFLTNIDLKFWFQNISNYFKR